MNKQQLIEALNSLRDNCPHPMRHAAFDEVVYLAHQLTEPSPAPCEQEAFEEGYDAGRDRISFDKALAEWQARAVQSEAKPELPSWLLNSAEVLLKMDSDGVLVPHEIGNHARDVIQAFLDYHKATIESLSLNGKNI